MSTPINTNLIGVKNSARELQTPALVLDLTMFRSNLKRLQSQCTKNDISLRPHCKTHKSATIANEQIQLGAVGVCTAKIGEAEALASQGVESLLVTSPIVTEQGVRRAIDLAEKTSELILVVDNDGVAEKLNSIADSADVTFDVLLDLDPGMHRTGIEIGSRAFELAQKLEHECQSLTFRGVQFYAGNLMHVRDYTERRGRYMNGMNKLKSFVEQLRGKGLSCEIVTGGGTGSHDFDFESGIMTELQAGSYAFMDRQYLEVLNKKGEPLNFQPALHVYTTVVSSNTPGMATTDAGLKAFATDADMPWVVLGGPPDSTYSFMGDEHGCIRWSDNSIQVPVGQQIRTVVPHCDPTFNLYDVVHVVDNECLVDIWKIDARGRSD